MNTKRAFEIFFDNKNIFTFKRSSDSLPILEGWAKIIPGTSFLPLPSSVQYSSHIPGKLLLEDSYTLNPSDIVIEAYLFETFRSKKGATVYRWNYRISGFDFLGNFVSYQDNWREIKNQMKDHGMSKTLLAGSKPLAALVRVAHALRLDIPLTS
jgi:hypothetical protein